MIRTAHGATDLAAAARLSRATRALHWAVAVAILAMLAFGFWLQTLPSGPGRGPYVQSHKSFGLLVFLLALARVAWRAREGFPRPAGAHGAWQRRGAITMHVFLLAGTLLMPITGILRSLAYARPVALFGLPVLPQMFEVKNEALYAVASTAHDWLAIALAAAIALHAAAALTLHLRGGDRTLARMAGWRGGDR